MKPTNYKDHLLVAMPSLQDDFFAKSVVYIYEYSVKQGALGFIINKPLSATLDKVLEHLNITCDQGLETYRVFSGGPVDPDQGFVLHDNLTIRSNKSDKLLTVGTSRDILEEIAVCKGPEHFMVTLGYAAWKPGQLETEIQQGDWLIAPCDKAFIFDTPIALRWKSAAKLVGVDLNHLSSHIGHA